MIHSQTGLSVCITYDLIIVNQFNLLRPRALVWDAFLISSSYLGLIGPKKKYTK